MSGDNHIVMCDGQTRYDWQGEGLYQMFISNDIHAECATSAVFPNNATSIQVASIDWCRVRITRGSCDLVVQTDLDADGLNVNGALLDKDAIQAFNDNHGDEGVRLRVDRDNAISIKVSSSSGDVTLVLGKFLFGVSAPALTQCSGMCGSCSNQSGTPPPAPGVLAQRYHTTSVVTSSNLCRVGSVNATLPNVFIPDFNAPNDTLVPSGSVAFESEKVMRRVVHQCLCGQDERRMQTDKAFGASVEACVFDKAIGAGAEHIAKSNLDMYAALHNVPLNTTGILDEVVMKPLAALGANEGCTYEFDLRGTGPMASSSRFKARGQRYHASGVETSAALFGKVVAAEKMKVKFELEVPVVVIQPMQRQTQRHQQGDLDGGDDRDEADGGQRSVIPIAQTSASSSAQTSTSPAPPSSSTNATSSSLAPRAAANVSVPTPAPTTAKPTVKQIQIVTMMRERSVPQAALPTATAPPTMSPMEQQAVRASLSQAVAGLSPSSGPAPVPVPVGPAVAAAVPAMAAAPVTMPMMMGATMPAVVQQAPEPFEMEMRITPDQQRRLQQEQATQLQALQQKQRQDRQRLLGQQALQRQALSRPVSVEVQAAATAPAALLAVPVAGAAINAGVTMGGGGSGAFAMPRGGVQMMQSGAMQAMQSGGAGASAAQTTAPGVPTSQATSAPATVANTTSAPATAAASTRPTYAPVTSPAPSTGPRSGAGTGSGSGNPTL